MTATDYNPDYFLIFEIYDQTKTSLATTLRTLRTYNGTQFNGNR